MLVNIIWHYHSWDRSKNIFYVGCYLHEINSVMDLQRSRSHQNIFIQQINKDIYYIVNTFSQNMNNALKYILFDQPGKMLEIFH